MLSLRDLEQRIAERREEIDLYTREATLIRQLTTNERRATTPCERARLRCQLGYALIRLGSRLAA